MKEDNNGDFFGVLFESDSPEASSNGVPSSEVTEKVIGCAYKVSNALGCGFLEKVYENALAHELRKAGFRVDQQERVKVFYDGVEVGYYDADLIVEGKLIIEVKALRTLEDSHKAQCLNYLKATGNRLGLLINFGSPRVEVRRVAL
jgi:GxxExxY protein